MDSLMHLYRITDDDSRDKFSEANGFIAPIDQFDPSAQGAKTFVELHLDWSNKKPTPFISTIDSHHNAIYLAEKRARRKMGVRIAIIDRDKVESQGVVVYHMESLVRDTIAILPSVARNNTEHLCVHRIPREAILKICSLEEFSHYHECLGELGVFAYIIPESC